MTHDNKRILRLVAALLTGCILMTGCTQANLTATETAHTDEISLTVCSIGGVDIHVVERIGEQLEALLEEKLNQKIDLTLMTVSRGNYNEQLNLMFLRGEAPDVFAIYQQPAFSNLAEGGKLMPLNGLLKAHFSAGETIPEELWSRTTRDGIVFGIPQYYKEAQYVTYVLQTEYAQEFHVDTQRLWTWEELHELLLQIKEKYPDSYPVLPHYGSVMNFLGQDCLGDNLGVLVDESSSSTAVENWYASETYYQFCKQMHTWYQEGLVLPDAYDTQTNIYSMIQSGVGQGGIFRSRILKYKDWVEIRLSEYTADTWMDDVLWGISGQCEHAELAMQVLNCLYSDPEVAMLMSYGEEGIEYTLDEAQNMALLEPASSAEYWPGIAWAWPGIASLTGHVNNLDQFWDRISSDQVAYSPAYGFVYDPSNVQLEVEQCQSVVDKYHKGLVCGFFDPDTVIPQFLAELEDAGINTIIAEKQRQLDAWLQSQ